MNCEYGGDGRCRSEATKLVYAGELPVLGACDIHAGDLITQGFTIKPIEQTPNKKGKQTMPRNKGKTDELPNMPQPEGLGLAAQNFRTAIEKLDAAKEEKGETSDALFKALVKAKRTSITIDGYVFEREHKGPVDKIKVTKPK